ncbi:MAG: toprim domain-containing protein, partial [Zavarzinia sp.]|nr:toprim domain-containing protein [Zavarzinia sp.]
MKTIVICEKGSQRANIIAAIGDSFGQVLAASGHLFTLATPEQYGPPWDDWRGFHVYRPAGDGWRMVPTSDPDEGRDKIGRAARETIGRALASAQRVYIATDADREGEVIGREILDEFGFQGEAFRVLFTSEDPATIRDAFAAARPAREREPIYQAGLARARADYIWNFSLTRAATSALVQAGARTVIGVGRVKSPTLAIVCRREIQILQH